MSQSAPTIRVLTWNVHGCVGRDGVRDPNRVARVLEAAQPDISALQEIDSRTRAAAHDPFSYFGELFGWTTVSARTLTAKDGHYGHIVLSRWPIESLGEIDLSMRWSEPRKAIVGAIQSSRRARDRDRGPSWPLAVRAPQAVRPAARANRDDRGRPADRARGLQRLSPAIASAPAIPHRSQ